MPSKKDTVKIQNAIKDFYANKIVKLLRDDYEVPSDVMTELRLDHNCRLVYGKVASDGISDNVFDIRTEVPAATIRNIYFPIVSSIFLGKKEAFENTFEKGKFIYAFLYLMPNSSEYILVEALKADCVGTRKKELDAIIASRKALETKHADFDMFKKYLHRKLVEEADEMSLDPKELYAQNKDLLPSKVIYQIERALTRFTRGDDSVKIRYEDKVRALCILFKEKECNPKKLSKKTVKHVMLDGSKTDAIVESINAGNNKLLINNIDVTVAKELAETIAKEMGGKVITVDVGTGDVVGLFGLDTSYSGSCLGQISLQLLEEKYDCCKDVILLTGLESAPSLKSRGEENPRANIDKLVATGILKDEFLRLPLQLKGVVLTTCAGAVKITSAPAKTIDAMGVYDEKLAEKWLVSKGTPRDVAKACSEFAYDCQSALENMYAFKSFSGKAKDFAEYLLNTIKVSDKLLYVYFWHKMQGQYTKESEKSINALLSKLKLFQDDDNTKEKELCEAKLKCFISCFKSKEDAFSEFSPKAFIEHANEKVYGNDLAKKLIASTCYERAFKKGSKSTPIMFVGEAGVGKSLLIRTVADEMNAHFVEINCANQILDSSVMGLGLLLTRVTETVISEADNPKKSIVILLDEADKLRDSGFSLLSMFENKLTDTYLKENLDVDFQFFITANDEHLIYKAVTNRCMIISFSGYSTRDERNHVFDYLIREMEAEYGTSVCVEPDARDMIVGYNSADNGARSMKTLFNSAIRLALLDCDGTKDTIMVTCDTVNELIAGAHKNKSLGF